MRFLFKRVHDFLHARERFAPDARARGRLRWLVLFVFVFGIFYGAVMGTFTGLAPGRFHQLVYSGVKVPILLLVTFALCLPSFFVINTVAGLRDDFRQAVAAVIATQSCITIVLGALAPVTALFYMSTTTYSHAILFNGLVFATAGVWAQRVVRRYYVPLIKRDRRHRHMLALWLVLYLFVAIQMAWVLRPFVGNPAIPVAFFRKNAWGNAYVVVARLIMDLLR